MREVSRGAAVRIRRAELAAEARRNKAVLQKAREEQRAQAQREKFAAKIELAKLRVAMTAREDASKHIAKFGPFYLLLLVGAFLFSINYIPESQISVVSALLTLLVTSIAANLRSIVAGESDNGHGNDEAKPKPSAKK